MMSAVVGFIFSVFLSQAPLTGTIEGTVCEVETCKPIPGARVAIATPGVPTSRKTTVSDVGGRFRFQLVPGKYMLDVAADNFAVTGNTPFLSIDDVSSFQTVKVEMHALGTISGRAFDEKGEPLVDARVEALVFRAETIGQVLSPIAFADTNDLGEYRIASLESNDYYIRITPPGNRILADSYPVTYYPNTTDAAMAAKIVVGGGGEVTGIDAKLPSRGVKVRGKVIQADGKNTRLIIFMMPRSPSVMVGAILGPNTTDQASDEFELRGVAPGSYYLYAITRGEPPNGLEWVRFPIEVADKDVDEFKAPITPAGTIKGHIIVNEDAAEPEKLDLTSISLSAGPAELPPLTGWAPASARVDKNGDFAFQHVSETKLFLRDQALNDNWFISSARFNGSDAITNGFSGQPGKEGTLEVVLSNASGALAGVVKNKQEKPVPAGRIALLPEPAFRSNPFLVRTTVAIEEGKFTMETIPPGDYTAIAFPDEDKFTPAFLRDLPSIQKYERFGQQVTIEAKQTKRLDLTVAPSEP
jgi:hypothetical protein